MIGQLAWKQWRRVTPTAVSIAGLVLLSVTTPSLGNQKSADYIGLRYQTLPGGIQGKGSWSIESKDGFGVSEVKVRGKRMLWLEALVSYDNAGRPQVEVIDVLVLPQLMPSEEIAGGSAYKCELNGKSEPELVAIVNTENINTQYINQVRKSWRANTRTGRFEEIAPRNIVCENPGWGL